MFAKGYRPNGANQHISVVKFAGLFLDEDGVLVFDRMRRKRHSSVYDTAGTEAEFAVGAAEVLVHKVEPFLRYSLPYAPARAGVLGRGGRLV